MVTYGTWAVIAGASEGIGAAFARQLGAAGYALVLIARRAAPLDALACDLRATGITVETHVLDLSAPELERVLQPLAARDIGVLVWNAALSITAPFLDIPLADHHRMLDTNARGPVTAAHVFGAAMATRGRGAIILLSSLTAFWGSAYLATYGATKAFNLSLAEALACELGPAGIDVVACCAGATSTPGFNALVGDRKGPRSMTPDAVARITLARLHRRGAIVPGGFNAFAQWLMSRLFPRRLAISIMAGETRKLLHVRPDRTQV